MRSIEDMPEQDRPREKMRAKGVSALTDEELVQGILGRGVHPREVFADVIADRAAAVIFAHNHPSGELKPSDADLKIHAQLTQAAKILGLRILDQIIVTRKGHCSFQETGLLA